MLCTLHFIITTITTPFSAQLIQQPVNRKSSRLLVSIPNKLKINTSQLYDNNYELPTEPTQQHI